ncbi:hypothetical protein [Sulfurimonas sp.]
MVTRNRRDAAIKPTLRQKVWNYMRRNRNFVVGDIMAITGIKYGNLRDMLKVLEIVGYVIAVSKEKPLTSNRYKLVKCTGAKVPIYTHKKQLFYDSNLNITIEVKRTPSIQKILNEMTKTPITKEEINKATMLSHATDVKCYRKLKELGIIIRTSPIQKNSDGHVVFNIDLDELEKFKEKIESGEIDINTIFKKK